MEEMATGVFDSESIAANALKFAMKAKEEFSAVDERTATDSGQFLRELSEISPQSVANPLMCDGIFVCSNVLEDSNASSSRKSHAFAILANMFVDEDVLLRTQLHKNKKLAKITIEHLFSLDTRIDRPCLTQVARLLVAAGQKCKNLGYQWGELGDDDDEVWWLARDADDIAVGFTSRRDGSPTRSGSPTRTGVRKKGWVVGRSTV